MVGQYEFILLSSASLEMKDWDQSAYARTQAFLETVRMGTPPASRLQGDHGAVLTQQAI